MSSSHVSALSAPAAVLLGSIAVLVTRCAAVPGARSPPADRARSAQVAARTTRPGGSRIALDPPFSRSAYLAGRQAVARRTRAGRR